MTARQIRSYAILPFLLFLIAPAMGQEGTDEAPNDLWLEELEGDRALEWVRSQNERTEAALRTLPVYDSLRGDLRQMIQRLGERVPIPSIWGDYLYDFWRDAEHQRGLWRRTSPDSFLSGDPEWEVLIDVDSLAAAEEEPWVFAGTECLPPEFLRCVVFLSRRGSDAVVVREYDAGPKHFVEGGFFLPEAKQGVEWRDENSLYVYSAQDPMGATRSGAPRVVRIWERGEPLADAPVVFEGDVSDTRVSVYNIVTHERTVPILAHRRSLFTAELHVIEDGELVSLELPPDPDLRLAGSQMVIHPKQDWTAGERTYPGGALLAIDFERFLEGDRDFTVVLAPEERTTIQQVRRTRNLLLVSLLRDVKGELHVFEHRDGAWTSRKVDTPEIGTVGITANDEFSDLFLFVHTSFLTPPTPFAHRDDGEMVRVGSFPELFDASGLVEKQFWATSRDGTRVPYFVVGPQDVVEGSRDGPDRRRRAAAVLRAYGGFGSTETAAYVVPHEAALLERGIVLAVANVRGGGELGPEWHRAGQRENRQNSYDDFIAVAEDLIRRGITSPERLAMTGASNSGLLVGAVLTQRPDLFGAAHAAVPLFDMKRYTKLLAGPNWIDEYGDPDDPEEWAFLREYSPYQNLSADADYPPFLITTRTHDDRVHPAHGRRMAARMQAMGHDVLFHEAGTGGHGATETFDDVIGTTSMTSAFLLDRLGVTGDTVRVAPPTGEQETDRASIQTVLEEVQPGGTVEFAAGTYVVGEVISLETPRVTLLGHPDGTTLRGCNPAEYEELEGEAVRAIASGEPDAAGALHRQCGMFALTGGHVTVRDLTFEYSRLGLLLGCCHADEVLRPSPGGYRIEGNSFRNSGNSIRAILAATEATVIRGNRFINTFHALSATASRLHVLDNDISMPEPGRVPGTGHPGFAIGITALPPDRIVAGANVCVQNIIAGNRIDGHPDGILLSARQPGASCRENVVRENTIQVRRVRFPVPWLYADLIPLTSPADSTFVGVPLALSAFTAGSDSADDQRAPARVENNRVEDNRIIGAEGLGIAIAHASGNRVANNTITGIERREPFPGNRVGWLSTEWREANGSGIWVSPGSDGNEIVGNTFENVAGAAVFVEGDDNRVELRYAGDSERDLGTGNEVTRPDGDGERSPEEQTSDTVHVAPPIGETNSDRVSVQAAFDAVQPGGTVAFAAGTYVIGGDGLVLRTPGVALIGHPAGTTLQGCTREQRIGLEANEFLEACGDGLVLAAEMQRVSSLRFESFSLALSIREATETEKQGRSPGFTGGHVVEGNSFHDGFSFQVVLDADSTIRIRRNVFRNTWHAVAIGGRNIHVTDNDIAVPEPERVPFGFAGVAIGIRPHDDGVCSSMVVAGNRIDGHTEAVAIAVFPQDPPGAECSHIMIRDNEIVMRRVRMPDGSDQAGRLAIAPAIRLYNAQRLVGEGLIRRIVWEEHWMPEGGWPAALSDGRISDVSVVGNHITGAVGVAIEAAHVTDSRIMDNEIEVRPATTPEELDGLELGGNGGPGVWVLLGLVDEVNGTPVWVSQGSEDNIVRNPR